jgi:hypothetical protein
MREEARCAGFSAYCWRSGHTHCSPDAADGLTNVSTEHGLVQRRAAEGDGGQEPLVDPGVVDDDDEALVGGHVQRRLHPLVEVVARS